MRHYLIIFSLTATVFGCSQAVEPSGGEPITLLSDPDAGGEDADVIEHETDAYPTDGSLVPDQDIIEPTDRSATIDIEINPPLRPGGFRTTLIRGGFVTEDDPFCVDRIEVDGCVVQDCPKHDQATYASPGKLTFAPAIDGRISFNSGPNRLYFRADQILWQPDELFRITGEGDTRSDEHVEGFVIDVSSPVEASIADPSQTFNVPLDRSNPMTTFWNRVDEKVELTFRQGRDTNDGEWEQTIRCVVDGAVGRATFQPTLLQHLQTGWTMLDIYTIRETKQRVGRYDLTVRVRRSRDADWSYDVQ